MGLVNDHNARRRAFSNIVSTLDFGVFLPKHLFKLGWTNFLFFPSEFMFKEEFVEVLAELLRIEGANVCCLLNINLTNSFEFDKIEAIFLDKTVTGKEFIARLCGDGSSVGWLYRVDDYACTSEVGDWCIYCDRENDIAVVGFRSDCESEKFRSPMEKLFAKPFRAIVNGDVERLFPFNMLTPSWSNELCKNYIGPYKDQGRKADTR